MRWADYITAALLMEVAVDKPGNVSPRHRFHDMGLEEFTRSAFAVGQTLQQASLGRWRYGCAVQETVMNSLNATGGVNVHLGSILLMTPLVLGYQDDWRAGVADLIGHLGVKDTDRVFGAIRRAHPGGLVAASQVKDDVFRPAARPLLDVFSDAAAYDWIAREYCLSFQTVFGRWAPYLQTQLKRGQAWDQAILSLYIEMLGENPDSLWIRKNGRAAAELKHRLVKEAIVRGDRRELSRLLEDPENRWNPGTTADLVAAAILVALVKGDRP